MEILSAENLLTIKAVLGNFELASDLKVDFYKSCWFEFNMGRYFIYRTGVYLHYKVGTLLSKFRTSGGCEPEEGMDLGSSCEASL